MTLKETIFTDDGEMQPKHGATHGDGTLNLFMDLQLKTLVKGGFRFILSLTSNSYE